MMNNQNRIVRIANWLAGVMGLIVAVVIPLGYYGISYRYTVGSLEAEAEINSRIFSELVNKNPEMWRFEQIRLEELLTRRPGTGQKEIRRIVDLRNKILAQNADSLGPPLISRSYPIKDSGVTVARIEIIRSMRPILIVTGLIACFSLIIGLTLFIVVRILPFRAVIKAEQLLRESERRHRELFERAPVGIFSARSDGQPIAVNPTMARLLGFDSPEMALRNHTDLAPDLFLGAHGRDELLRKLQESGFVEDFEYRALTAHKQIIWLSMNARVAEKDENGSFAIHGFATDISERKRSETEREKLKTQLYQSQKMEAVGRLAGGIAHDFNNMLNIINGYSEMALGEIEPGDPLRDDIQEILNAGRRSSDLTRQLLAFARKQTIAPEILDLNQTISNMLKMLQRLIGENIDLLWKPAPSLWPVKMDPAQIDQLLANLLVNARDAISDFGKVTIETDNVEFDESYCGQHPGFVPGEYVLLAISDDGCGMEKELLDKLFEPFFTTKSQGEGTGLGLAMVYGIVKQNSGFINVYSEPGKGTTFKIYLAREVHEEKKIHVLRKHSTAPTGNETVLLVEDEAALLKFTGDILKRHGYTVLSANRPAEALSIAEKYPDDIHFLLTDVVMPEMNGRDLMERLRTIRPAIKILFMSGYTPNAIAHHGVLDEGMQLIQKPFSPKVLVQKVREVLDGH